jgi:hypothetical protein
VRFVLLRRRTLVADDLQVTHVDHTWTTSVRLRGPAGPYERLELRLHDTDEGRDGDAVPIDTSATAFLPVLTMLAQSQGCGLRVDAPVDTVALAGAQRASGVTSDWFGWPRVLVTARRRVPSLPAAGGVGLFFSRGLDSMYSLFHGLHQADRLISIDWIDAPLAGVGTQAVMRGTVAAAAEAGLPLLRVSSNSRRFTDPLIGWDDAVGPTLASFALLLAPTFGTVVIAATLPDHLMRPRGTHPQLDPLWSSSRVRIVHDGSMLGRTDKAAAVADEPLVQQRLKVCWEREGDGNCGRCAKCLMTLTNFAAAGRLDAVADRFEAPLSADAVRAVTDARVAHENIVEVVERTAPGELHDAWAALLQRHPEHV